MIRLLSNLQLPIRPLLSYHAECIHSAEVDDQSLHYLISLYFYETLWLIVSATNWKCSTTVQIGHCHLVFVILLIPKTNCCLIILCVCLTLTESPFQSKNGALFWVATFVHAAAHRYAMNGHVRFVNKTQVHIITEDKLLDHRWKNILLRWNYWTMQYSVPMYFPIQ